MAGITARELTATVEGVQVPMVFMFEEDDPFAVTLRVNLEDPDRDWRFARSILLTALTWGPNEPGHDVLACREGNQGQHFVVTIAAGAKPVELSFSTHEVHAFLRHAHDVVPYGREVIDWTRAEEALGLRPGQLTQEV